MINEHMQSSRQKITFCAITSLIFNGYCSSFKHLGLKLGHIFLPSLKILSSKIKNPSNYYIKSEPFLPIWHVYQNLQFLMIDK